MKIKLNKIILYPDDDVFEEVRDFYHDLIGLEYIVEPTKYWVEFETGGTPIGLHHNSCYKDGFGKKTKQQFFSFEIDSVEELKEKYNQLKNFGFTVAETVYSNDANRLGALMEGENAFLFLVRDPMGNDVRILRKKIKTN